MRITEATITELQERPAGPGRAGQRPRRPPRHLARRQGRRQRLHPRRHRRRQGHHRGRPARHRRGGQPAGGARRVTMHLLHLTSHLRLRRHWRERSPMPDYEISPYPVTHEHARYTVHLVEGLTERGEEFIDAYTYPDDTTRMLVLDSGRIVLHEQALPAFRQAAQQAGLVEA